MNDLATIIHHFFVCFYTPDDDDDWDQVVDDHRHGKTQKKKRRENQTKRSWHQQAKISNFQQKMHSWFDGCSVSLVSCPQNWLCLFSLVRMHFLYCFALIHTHESRYCSVAVVVVGARTHTHKLTYAGCEGLRANKTILFFFLHWRIRVSIEWYIFLLFGSLCFAFVVVFFFFLLSKDLCSARWLLINRNGIMRIESECRGKIPRKKTTKRRRKKHCAIVKDQNHSAMKLYSCDWIASS